jgi:PAS domain S-box-containing protein
MAVPATKTAAERSEALQVFLDASAMLLATSSRKTVVPGILDLAGHVLAADAYAVWRALDDRKTWRAIVLRGLSPAYRTEIKAAPEDGPTSIQATEDALSDPSLKPYRSIYAAEGIRSLLVVPLALRNGQVGTLTFYWRHYHSITEREKDYALALANLLAVALNTNELNELNRQEKSRLSFLAEASAILSNSLEYEKTLRAVANLAVPQIADWCAVYVVEDGRPHRIVVAHPNPATLKSAEVFFCHYPEEIRDDRGLGAVLRTGKSEMIADVTPDMLHIVARDANHLAAIDALGITSSMVVPLVSRGTVLGAIRLLAAGGTRHFNVEDLQLAEDLARRAAAAIENARLHRATLKQDSELRFSHSAARIGRWGWDLENRRMYWSEEYKELLGVPRGTSANEQGENELVHPEDRDRIQRQLDEALASGSDQIVLEYRVILPDERVLWIQSRGSISRDATGEPNSVLGISMDVTQSRRAENALRRTEQEAAKRNNEIAAIVQSSDDAIISKDLTGRIKSWNPAAFRIFGYSPEEIIGKSILLLIPEELRSEETVILNKIRAGEAIDHFETVRITKGGERINVSLSISPVRDENGTIIGASKTLRDITGKKRLEASLLQAEKIAAAGRMAATIAHEVNNPLEAITNLIFLAKVNADHPDSVREFLDQAESELIRVSHIARQTLGFYRENASASSACLSDLAERTMRIYEPKCREAGIAIEREFKSTQRVVLRTGEILQVISNIVANAIHAMPSGGALSISTEDVDGSAHPGVLISVKDSGVGISNQQLPKFSTPSFPRGLGWVQESGCLWRNNLLWGTAEGSTWRPASPRPPMGHECLFSSPSKTPIQRVRNRKNLSGKTIRSERSYQVRHDDSENLVTDSDAAAIGMQRPVDPVRPLLVFNVDRPEGQTPAELHINAPAVSDVGKPAVGIVVLEIHFGKPEQYLAIRSEASELMNRNARADQVIILADIDILVEPQPASLCLYLDPAAESHINVRTHT